MEQKVDLKSMREEELTAYVTGTLGLPRFRAGQIFQWLYKGVESFEEMTNLSREIRAMLEENCYIDVLKVEQKQVSTDGTIKYLWRLMDGNFVESVLMQYKHGNSICVSTQVGCAMGCRFCASTLEGKVRNLHASEILDQVLFAQKESGRPISNIVLMGIGEPLDNYDNVLTFLYNVNHEKGMNIGMRHISLSTCGLCDRIDQLAEEGLGITLSISLHAFNDEVRSEIMPINRRYNIATLLETCRRYIAKTGRRISFEYTLISGKNDSPQQARQLAALLRGMLCHVNLIPVNEVKECGFRRSDPRRVERFRQTLEQCGVNATVRRRLGGDIEASCGQLRRKASGMAAKDKAELKGR
ncbi:MAG: 23S rRNA (adenine(2503)-C(2))-methyltransferase RlmN [Eubacteriales bacterium]|jgi:23S rRNA (adenine2503-C2)-methyltransferase